MVTQITSDQVDRLEQAYRRGATMSRASRDARTSRHTAAIYFTRFAGAGVPRPLKLKREQRKSPFHGAPRYDGPDWIGKPAK